MKHEWMRGLWERLASHQCAMSRCWTPSVLTETKVTIVESLCATASLQSVPRKRTSCLGMSELGSPRVDLTFLDWPKLSQRPLPSPHPFAIRAI